MNTPNNQSCSCATNGWVCAHADPDATVDAPAAIASSIRPGDESPAASSPAVEGLINAIADQAPAVATAMGASSALAGDLAIGVAALRVLESVVSILKGSKGHEDAQFDAADVMHGVADQLAAHDAAAKALIAARFPEKP